MLNPPMRVAFVLAGLLGGACLSGCHSGASATLTNKDQAAFKGGPMPASARAEMAKRMQQAAQKAGASLPAAPPAK